MQKYYGGLPEYIHVAEHSFVECRLCIYFEMQMAFSQLVVAISPGVDVLNLTDMN